ncbi:thiosulfate sulfurtransferase [Lentinus tigrinus ALCF2SS1-7]|uniref:thiosulfate sulfurtransferase n=1 Tax=Lentinus tigrinus ALCF2SS1-7 TaxID=1328758 RepID=UPI00116631AB|nr:thiosulfate sulfurtransferase [Lentinus tigrinus ALCF2SS1-7]
MFGDNCPLVVTPAQLHNFKASEPSSSDLVILDASWHMPNSPRKADAEYLASHIPSARFLDIDRVASPHPLSLPHMMPDPETFVDACSKFGITPETHVVIYDTHGVFSSPRALYMFRAFGHHRSSILDGGLLGWQSHGGQTESGASENVQSTEYPTPSLIKDVVKDYEQMVANAELNPATNAGAFYVLDARPRGRFLGVDPEPRPGLSSGHMPYAVSLPFSAFVETHTVPEHIASKITDKLPLNYTRLRSNQAILAALEDVLGADRAQEVLEGRRPIVTSCGSGMTAGILWLGLKLLGVERVGLYDESWTGYAMRKESKIVKGE